MKKTERKRAESEQELPKIPRPLIQKVMRKIVKLEGSLRVQAFESGWSEVPTYAEVLKEYRGSVAMGVTSPLFIRRYGLICLAAVEALDEVYQDLHGYDPKAWRARGNLLDAESHLQTKKSAVAIENRRKSVQQAQELRTMLVRQAFASLGKAKPRDPSIFRYSEVIAQFEREWWSHHEHVGQQTSPPPTRNTLKPVIDTVRAELKEK